MITANRASFAKRLPRPGRTTITLCAITLGALLLPAAAPRADAADKNTIVRRAQLQVHVCNRNWAGSADALRVSLRSGNSTRYDRPTAKNFARNNWYTFDLVLNSVNRVRDITRLNLYNPKGDWLCLDRVLLLINGRVIAAKTGAMGFEHSSRNIFTYDTLRQSTWWRGWNSPAMPSSLTSAEMQSRVFARVGHHMTTGQSWDGILNFNSKYRIFYGSFWGSRSNTWSIIFGGGLKLNREGRWDKGVGFTSRLQLDCRNGRPYFTTHSMSFDGGGSQAHSQLSLLAHRVATGLNNDLSGYSCSSRMQSSSSGAIRLR